MSHRARGRQLAPHLVGWAIFGLACAQPIRPVCVDPSLPVYTFEIECLDLLHKGRFQEAKAKCLEQLELVPTTHAYLYLGQIAALEGHHADAVHYSHASIALNAEQVEAHNILGVVYHEQGDLDRAAEHAEIAAEIDPYSWIYQRNLGFIYLARSELDLARERFQKCLLIDPEAQDCEEGLAVARET
ncbi:MAG: tetratricopeptide repeat protein [Myxococcota bacterium]